MASEELVKFDNAGLRFKPRQKRKKRSQTDSAFWPLRNASFSIYKGDIVGLIGKNGSGKTTCGRLLSGVYEPTEGQIVRNRKVTLLTLGTGFNAELTGRQNIYINGAYLGFNRRKLKSIEEVIIDFAELEDFIDQPIKIYSSGMRTRLAFSIASHLAPEVLVLDEVLATGDRFFRVKAEKKILQLMESADAVIIISHQESVLRKLCNRAIWLQDGGIRDSGPIDEILDKYQKSA